MSDQDRDEGELRDAAGKPIFFNEVREHVRTYGEASPPAAEFAWLACYERALTLVEGSLATMQREVSAMAARGAGDDAHILALTERAEKAEKERDEARGLLRDVDMAWSDCLLTEDQADVLDRVATHLGRTE